MGVGMLGEFSDWLKEHTGLSLGEWLLLWATIVAGALIVARRRKSAGRTASS